MKTVYRRGQEHRAVQLVICRDENNMSRVMRNPDFCTCENKGAGQLPSFSVFAVYLLPTESEISMIKPSSVVVQPRLCRTWSEILMIGILATRLIKGGS